MTSFKDALSISASGLRAQSSRLKYLSENIANVDTPGYRRKIISFEAAVDGKIAVGDMRLDQSELTQIHDPSHPLADDSGNYLGSNVNILFEIADSREAQRSYEANLKLFDQARQMSANLLDLLKR